MKKKTTIAALVAITALTATAALAGPSLTWPVPGTTATLSLAPVARITGALRLKKATAPRSAQTSRSTFATPVPSI